MDSWFEVVESLPNARVRLIIFPHAGAMPQSYFKWAKSLAPTVETVVASYPYRGVRKEAESVPDTFVAKVKTMVDCLEREVIDVPYMLFGHSYGSLLAFEIAREISRRNLVLPLHLFVSSSLSPVDFASGVPKLSQLSNEDLYDEAVKKGWFEATSANELKASKMAGFQFLKADLAYYESYQYNAVSHIPITELVTFGATALRAAGDLSVPAHSPDSWATVLVGEQQTQAIANNFPVHDDVKLTGQETSATGDHGRTRVVRVAKFVDNKAGHFYIDTHFPALRQLLIETAHEMFESLPRAVVHGSILHDYQRVTYNTILHEAVADSARRFPDRTALIDEPTGHSMTYADLDAEATGIALWLLKHNCVRVGKFRTAPAEVIARGSCWPVAVLLPQDSFYTALNVALLTAGGALMPFYDNYSDTLVAQLLETTQCEVAFTTPQGLARFPNETATHEVIFDLDTPATSSHNGTDAVAPGLPNRSPQKKKIFVVDPQNLEFRMKLREWGRTASEKARLQKLLPACVPEDCAMLSFTSGSTGHPKVCKIHLVVCSLFVQTRI